MTQPMQRLSDLSDHHPRGRIVTKAAENHALSDHPTTSDRKAESDGKKQGWSPAAWGARRHAASDETEVAARISFYLSAMAEAAEALGAPDPDLVLETRQHDHDDAERVAPVGQYADPAAVAAGMTFCFPCGQPVACSERAWSNARGWCCPTCYSHWSTPQ